MLADRNRHAERRADARLGEKRTGVARGRALDGAPRRVRTAPNMTPSAVFTRIASRYFLEFRKNVSSRDTVTGTGFPSFVAGLNFHCFAAMSA